MRKKLALVLYLLLVDVIASYMIVAPVQAFTAADSTTGFVRRATAASMTSLMGAQRAANVSALATAIAASSAGTVAVRTVASSVGWPLLGIAAGMTLAAVWYSQSDVGAIKAASTGPAPYTIPGYTMPVGGVVTPCASCYLAGGAGYELTVPNPYPYDTMVGCAGATYVGPVPLGWGPWGSYGTAAGCKSLHSATVNSSSPIVGVAPPPTPAQLSTYLGGLSAGDPKSVESHSAPVGSQSTPADSVTSLPVPSSAVATEVVPASQIAPTDTVINPNATAPAGPTPPHPSTQTATQAKTTTATTVTNPDGSTTTTSTETQTETAVSQCSAGNHEQRSFGGILQAHMDLWTGSGLLSALKLLKNLTWPSAIPSFALSSTLFGNFTLDFSAWAGMLTALRSLIMAIAGFVAYRIVFVGST